MANNAIDLTTLANAKLLAGVSTTSDDALFALLISRVSAAFSRYCHRAFGFGTYDEFYTPTDRQLLILRNYPIQAITAVLVKGISLTDGTDFLHSLDDDQKGQLYMEQGWSSGEFLTTGLTMDPVAKTRSIEVKYNAGYRLPNDGSYNPGDSLSLPLDISDACDEEVVRRYWEAKRQAQGVSAFKEGNVSFNFKDGISQDVKDVLDKYRKAVFA